jgi:L-iditol 2-dehydrogenase
MKALLLAEYERLEIIDSPRPACAPGDALIRVAACGICGSDVHGYDGSSGRRIPPLVMGHEAAGTIAALGSASSSFNIGDRVTFDSTVSCGDCDFCRRGDVNLCDKREVLGVSCGDYRRAGAFAEYIVVPERILYPLPAEMSFPEAAMLEAVAVAMHAVKLSAAQGGENALVIGAGMIGLLIMQAVRAAGFAHVTIADLDASRLELARRLGADETRHASGAELTSQILAATHNRGVDVVFEAVGRPETVAVAIDSVRKGGTVVLVGNISPQANLPLQKVVSRQIRLQGSAASAGEYPEAIEMISSGRIQVKPLISAIAPLEDGPQWFQRLYKGEPGLMKVVLSPNPEVLQQPAESAQ